MYIVFVCVCRFHCLAAVIPLRGKQSPQQAFFEHWCLTQVNYLLSKNTFIYFPISQTTNNYLNVNCLLL